MINVEVLDKELPDYAEIISKKNKTKEIEVESYNVPSGRESKHSRWEHQNQNGSKDKRFKDNIEYVIYKEISTYVTYINTELEINNSKITINGEVIIDEFISKLHN